MSAGIYNLSIEQGATFDLEIRYKDANGDPVDLTGYDARLQIREFIYSQNFVLGLDSSESLNNIYTGGSAGTIDINIQPEITKDFVPGNYVYDLEIYTSSNVYRLIQGKFTVTSEVTR